MCTNGRTFDIIINRERDITFLNNLTIIGGITNDEPTTINYRRTN